MDKREADDLLSAVECEFRKKPYSELLKSLGNHAFERTGKSGKTYQLEADVLWDNESKKHLMVLLSIDDGGLLSSLVPLSRSFIVTPSGILRRQ